MNIRWIHNRHRDGRSLSDDPSPQSQKRLSLACFFRLIAEHLLQQSVGLQPVLFVMCSTVRFFLLLRNNKLYRYHNISAKVVSQLSRLLSNLLSTFNKFISLIQCLRHELFTEAHAYIPACAYLYLLPVVTEITYVEIFQLQKRIPFLHLK